MLTPGAKAGRYVVESILGEGGMGIVYQAHDEKLDRKVALKMLASAGDEAARGLVLREARAVAALDHPNAIAIYDVGEVDGEPYIAMELVQGDTLRAYVGDTRASVGRKIRWLVDVARALGAAHRAGIVHRDVKPENVMVRPDGRIKVLDFGIARRNAPVDPAAPTARAQPTASTTGGFLGTPMYMAPEQVRGRAADGRTDQFSWGVVAYELLEGQRPWEAQDALGIVAAMMSEPPRPMSASSLPDEVKRVVMRAISLAPAERFGSMEDIVELLEPLGEQGERAKPDTGSGSGPSGGGKKAPDGGSSGKSKSNRRYSTQDLGQAIALALERKAKIEAEGGKYAYQDLVGAAREVGIEEEELRDALDELRPAMASPVKEDSGARRLRHKQALQRHAALWAVFSVFFFLLDAVTAGGAFWYFPVLGWGVGLAAHAVSYFFPVGRSPEEEEAIRRHMKRRQEKLERWDEEREKRRNKRERKLRIEPADTARGEEEASTTEDAALLEALAEEEAKKPERRRAR